MRGGLQLCKVKSWIRGRFYGRDHERHIVRLAAGHDRRRGNFLHRSQAHGRPKLANDHISILTTSEYKFSYSGESRNNHRQAIRTVHFVQHLKRLFLTSRF